MYYENQKLHENSNQLHLVPTMGLATAIHLKYSHRIKINQTHFVSTVKGKDPEEEDDEQCP